VMGFAYCGSCIFVFHFASSAKSFMDHAYLFYILHQAPNPLSWHNFPHTLE
jgi:hypothetical protein